jgi:hypothetical protein
LGEDRWESTKSEAQAKEQRKENKMARIIMKKMPSRRRLHKKGEEGRGEGRREGGEGREGKGGEEQRREGGREGVSCKVARIRNG